MKQATKRFACKIHLENKTMKSQATEHEVRHVPHRICDEDPVGSSPSQDFRVALGLDFNLSYRLHRSPREGLTQNATKMPSNLRWVSDSSQSNGDTT